MEAILRFLAGLLAFFGMLVIAYGSIAGGFGNFNSPSKGNETFEFIVWGFGVLMLGGYAVLGRPGGKENKEWKATPEDPDYIFSPRESKDENQSEQDNPITRPYNSKNH